MNRAATKEAAAVCPPVAAVSTVSAATRTVLAVDGELTECNKGVVLVIICSTGHTVGLLVITCSTGHSVAMFACWLLYVSQDTVSQCWPVGYYT